MMDLSTYKKLTNWPHCSPKQPKPRENVIITPKEAHPMDIDVKQEPKPGPEPMWKINETKSTRESVANYCREQMKRYSPIMVESILSKLKVIQNKAEYEGIKYV